MKLSYISFLFLLFLVLSAQNAQAQRTGLLLLNNLQQGVELNYNYDGQSETSKNNQSSTTKTNRSSQQLLEEKYNFKINYAVYDPNLLKGTFSVEGLLDQRFSDSNNFSQSSYGQTYNYNFSADLLYKSYTPVSFTRSLQTNHVQRDFVPSYDVTTDTNTVSLLVKNKFLPTSMRYTKTTVEMDGHDSSDRIQNFQILSVETRHKYQDISESELRILSVIDHSESKAGVNLSDNTTLGLNFRNHLHLGAKDKGRNILTTLLVNQSSATTYQNESLNLTEVITYPLGKALIATGNYSFLKSTTTFNETSTSGVSNTVNADLTHSLASSLTTRLGVFASNNDFDTGTEQTTGGSFSVAYLKKLPAQSKLQLQFSQQYQVTDRNFSTVNAQVLREQHAVVSNVGNSAVPDFLQLANVDVNPDSIVVENADQLIRSIPYVKDLDYRVVPFGIFTRIEIISPDIHVGDKLLISYSFLRNAQIQFSTSSRSAAFELSLLENKYRLFGNWNETWQDIMSGSASVVRLNSGNALHLGFDVNLDKLKYGSNVTYSSTNQEKNQSVDAFLQYGYRLGIGTISFNLDDRLTKSETISDSGPTNSSTVNSASVGLSYARSLFSSAFVSMAGTFTDSRGENMARDDATLGLNFGWQMGRLTVRLTAQENLRFEEVFSRSDHLQLRVSRVF